MVASRGRLAVVNQQTASLSVLYTRKPQAMVAKLVIVAKDIKDVVRYELHAKLANENAEVT